MATIGELINHIEKLFPYGKIKSTVETAALNFVKEQGKESLYNDFITAFYNLQSRVDLTQINNDNVWKISEQLINTVQNSVGLLNKTEYSIKTTTDTIKQTPSSISSSNYWTFGTWRHVLVYLAERAKNQYEEILTKLQGDVAEGQKKNYEAQLRVKEAYQNAVGRLSDEFNALFDKVGNDPNALLTEALMVESVQEKQRLSGGKGQGGRGGARGGRGGGRGEGSDRGGGMTDAEINEQMKNPFIPVRGKIPIKDDLIAFGLDNNYPLVMSTEAPDSLDWTTWRQGGLDQGYADITDRDLVNVSQKGMTRTYLEQLLKAVKDIWASYKDLIKKADPRQQDVANELVARVAEYIRYAPKSAQQTTEQTSAKPGVPGVSDYWTKIYNDGSAATELARKGYRQQTHTDGTVFWSKPVGDLSRVIMGTGPAAGKVFDYTKTGIVPRGLYETFNKNEL